MPSSGERVRPVAAEYRHLIGDHEAHPGTGQGYAAQQREVERPSVKKIGRRLPLFAAS